MKALGPNRIAAVEEQLPGRCCVCDGLLPRPGPRGKPAKYTCGRKACVANWVELCKADMRQHLRQAREALERAEEAFARV